MLENYLYNEINFTIDNLINDEIVEEKTKESIYNLTEKDIQDIYNVLINDNNLIQSINYLIEEEAQHEIFKKIFEEEEGQEND